MQDAYLVCQIQASRVTFVNGEWQGDAPLQQASQAQDPFATCPMLWDFLNAVAKDGWVLDTGYAVGDASDGFERVYLRRAGRGV